MLLLLPLLTGVSAGLRSMMPLAIVAWASQHWPGVQQSPVAFMAAPAAAYIFTALAVAELISDKLPFVPSRLTPGPLGTRVVSGGLCGAVLSAAAQQSLATGVIIGGIAGLAGSFAGFAGRKYFTAASQLPGFLRVVGIEQPRKRRRSNGAGTAARIRAWPAHAENYNPVFQSPARAFMARDSFHAKRPDNAGDLRRFWRSYTLFSGGFDGNLAQEHVKSR